MSTIKGWYEHNGETAQVIARGPLYVLLQHWIPRFRSSARCQGQERCFLCEESQPVQSVGVVPVSLPQSDTIHLLRLTSSESHLIQALQTMGPNLQGCRLLVTGSRFRTLGAKADGRSVTTFAPVEKYLASIGQALYARALREKLLDINRDVAHEA